MDNKYDIVIIGAGIAGLVAGNYLVDSGRRVLIVEQAKYPGGCACSFTRNGYRFDAAVHWISQAGQGGIVKLILDEFGLSDRVKFHRLPRPASIITSNGKLDLEFGKKGLVDAFSRAYPDEARSIATLWDETDATKEELWRLIKSDPGGRSALGKLLFNATFPLRFKRIAKYHKKPASDVVRGYCKDERLAASLDALGIFPGISFVHYSWFNSVGLDSDAYYPKGGIQAVPDALAARFIEKGGEIRYRALAEKITVEGGAAKGVTLAGGEAVTADTVISTGDARNTFLNMVGEDRLPKSFALGLRQWRQSESFFYVYLGTDMDLSAAGFDGAPVWYIPDSVDTKRFPMLGGRALGIGMPSLLDPSLAPSGKGIVILGMIASCAHMAGCPVRKDGTNDVMYKAVKEKIVDYMVELAGQAIPGIGDHIEIKFGASPHTFERYTMNYMGASSGWSMAADAQHKLPVKTPVRGLYLAGHWTMNPGGVPAAFVSGRMTAVEINKHR
jgi:phytoene dehydrogenase-like protein